jgi:3-deoxy-7-phosphoheptulonate synthase
MQLPSPKELRLQISTTPQAALFIEQMREQIKDLISNHDRRLAIVMGPCSIHDISSALEYAERLKHLSHIVEKSCLLVMRVYTEKPRTRIGWKGLLNDPHLNGREDIEEGLYQTRQLLVTLAEMNVAAATEFVDPLAHVYFNDLLSWGFIGARTSASQAHRELASSLSFPIGFKNPTDGDIDTAINGVISSRHRHSFISLNEEGMASISSGLGNPYSHIVLRGSTEGPNYNEIFTRSATRKLLANGLPGRLMIDCAHGNCSGHYLRQKEVFTNILERIHLGDDSLFGLMLESHLEPGNLLSKTDPCIDWETTQELVLQAHQLCSSISCC